MYLASGAFSGVHKQGAIQLTSWSHISIWSTQPLASSCLATWAKTSGPK